MPAWLSPGRLIGGFILLFVIVMGLVLIITGAVTRGTVAKVQARLSGNQVEAAQTNGSEAVNVVASAAAGEAAIDTITMENDHAIRSAPGAAATLDPELQYAGLRALCRRAAYHRDPKCLQFTAAK